MDNYTTDGVVLVFESTNSVAFEPYLNVPFLAAVVGMDDTTYLLWLHTKSFGS